MCYYNGIKIKFNDFIRLKELEHQFPHEDISILVQSGFDYANWPVIKPTADCDWEIVNMEWGFIPFYLKDRESIKKFREGFKDEKGKFHAPVTTLNAVGEELLKPNKMFRESALHRRCIVLSSGFYEWRHVPQVGKSGKVLKTTLKYPYFIKPSKGKFFFMAGVWQPWTDKETGEMIETFAIITTSANKLMEQIHNSKKRMPLILPEKEAGEWISDGLSEAEISRLANFQISADEMNAYNVYKNFRERENPMEEINIEGLNALIT